MKTSGINRNVIKRGKENLDIAKTIDDITGLVVDIYK
ncbi:YaaR family protein [Clostridium botulinum]|nr:YaaR family protein [Clostridium botulinum]